MCCWYGSVLIPVVVDVLHVVVFLQQVDELLHVLDVGLIGELDIVLGHHLHGGLQESVALLLQLGEHIAESVGGGVHGEHFLLHLHVVGAAVQRVHHHGVLVQVLPLDDDDALLVKGPGHAAGGAQALAVLVQQVTDLGGGALTVIGQSLHDDGHAVGAVALVDHALEVVAVPGAQSLVDGALDVVVGHVDGLGLGDNRGQTGVVVGVAGAAALFHGHDDLLGDLGEGGGALINQGQHILDIFQYLFGMPQRLFAVIPFGKYNPFAVDDEDTIVMEYDTGMTASFILTTGEACCEERMEIIGTKARLLLEDNTLSITRFDDIEKYIKTEDVNSREHLHFTEEKIMYEKSAEPYTQLLEKFAQAALKHDEGCLVAKGAEGLHSLMLCAGAYYSACKGIRVDLPLDAVRYKELMDNLIEDEKNRAEYLAADWNSGS